MRPLEILTELLRGLAITVVATWLFILAWLLVSALDDIPDSAVTLLLGSALMAGTAVYVLWPVLVPVGFLLGYLSGILASSSWRRPRAVIAGGVLGLVAGASCAWLGIQIFGRDMLPRFMGAHPAWIQVAAAVFAALAVAGYVAARRGARSGLKLSTISAMRR